MDETGESCPAANQPGRFRRNNNFEIDLTNQFKTFFISPMFGLSGRGLATILISAAPLSRLTNSLVKARISESFGLREKGRSEANEQSMDVSQ
jgi:hypothetical protein